MKLRFHPQARAELKAAARWYEEQRPGLGEEFLDEIRRQLDRISDSPGMWPIWPELLDHEPSIRKTRLDRFPYAIAFEQHGDAIVVVAIAHDKRRPFYWKSRVSGKTQAP